MAEYHTLGVFTITVGPTAAGTDFAGEFLNVQVGHPYEDVGDKRIMLDGTVRGASKERNDVVTGAVENDLTGAGLYAFLHTNDLTDTDIEIVHVGSGATWVGKVNLTLPSDIGADEFGAPVVSSVEWQAVGTLAYTPGTAPAP